MYDTELGKAGVEDVLECLVNRLGNWSENIAAQLYCLESPITPV